MSSSSNAPAASLSSEIESCKGHARRRRSLWELPLRGPKVAAGFLVRIPERLLHARRRRHATARLAAMQPRSILFLCVGNICRSPYAEHRLRRTLSPDVADRILIRSAGFGRWNRPSPSAALAEAERRGIDLTSHRSRAVTHDLVDSTDLFVVTARDQERRLRAEQGVDPDKILHLGDLDPQTIRQRTIVDPWGKADEVFHRSYDRIDRCLEVLARHLEGVVLTANREA